MFRKLLARLTKNNPKASLARKPKTLGFEGLENRIMFDVCPVSPVTMSQAESMAEVGPAQVAIIPQVERERDCEQAKAIPMPNADAVFAIFSVGILDIAGQVNVPTPRIQKPATDGLMA